MEWKWKGRQIRVSDKITLGVFRTDSREPKDPSGLVVVVGCLGRPAKQSFSPLIRIV